MKNLIPILLVLAISFVSCTKEGPQGPQGVQGYPGNDGQDGTLPQLYYFDIPVNQYNKEVYYDDNSVYYNDAWLAYGYIDGVVIQETDLVMVYMHQTTDGGPDNYFQALPYSDYTDNSEIFNHYSYGIMDDNGDLVFSIRRSNGYAPFDDMNATWAIEYNVYIIKGTQNRKAEIPSYVNLESEEELKRHLGITERKKVNFISR
jgi:hypothetical protein